MGIIKIMAEKGDDIITIWKIIFAISIIVEIGTRLLVSIWFCVGAIIAMILAYLGMSLELQLIGFLLGSLLTIFIFRPLLRDYMETPRVRTNYDALIGQEALVIEPIKRDSLGQVRVSGQVWTADAEEPVEVGGRVKVLRIEGVKLIVEKIEEV